MNVDKDQELRSVLVRAILTWSGVLFVVLAFAFALGYQHLANLMLARHARAWLGYQGTAIGRRVEAHDIAGLGRDAPALMAADDIAGLVLLDAGGKVLYSGFNPGWMPRHHGGPGPQMVPAQLSSQLVVFRSAVPGADARLWLIMDRQPVQATILATAAGVVILMLLLLATALLSVRMTLRRHPALSPRDSDHDAAVPQTMAEMPRQATASEPVVQAPPAAHADHDMRDMHFHEILERMTSCLWWADDTLRYRQASEHATELFGVDPKQLTNQPLWSWMPDQDQSLINREKLDQAVKSRDDSLHLAYLSVLPDQKKPRWLGEHINIQYDSNGKVRGLYGMSSDITKRRHQEQVVQAHIERARRMETVGTLVGGIAHEFNNILAGIVGNIFLLRQTQTDNPKAQDRLDRVDILIRKATGMIEQLLAFARKSQVQPGKFSLKAHVEDILRILEPQLDSGAKIITHLRSDAGVLANRTQLQQALTHIIDNADRALKGSPQPTITVSLEDFEANSDFLNHHPQIASSHLLHLTVIDNGQGIEPSVIDHIFEPFFTTREVGEGTGLGLSMVYGMIRHLGGAITVESQPGHGATFHLYFPRAEAISVEEDALGHVFYGRGETILLVEDEPIMRKVAAEVLQKLGYHAIEASDGPTALREFDANKEEIRLVMTDLIMPIMGGLKVASTIRKTAPDMPVLFITAHDLTDSVGPELSLPNSDLISKPFPIAALSACLRRLIDGEDAIQEAKESAPQPSPDHLH